MMTSSYLKLNNLLYLLVKDSCIIFILFLCYIQQLLAVSESSWLVCSSKSLERAFLYAPRPLIDRAPENDATSLTTYTTHSRASDTNIYMYRLLHPPECVIVYTHEIIFIYDRGRSPRSYMNIIECVSITHEGGV